MAPIADIIKYEGDNSTFIWKHPKEDFNSLTQLIVHESQEAIFFMNGQALDLFGPGRHTLETQNIPKIGRFLNQTTGGESPFHCEVYFINKTVQMAVKWGTDSKVRFIDPNYGVPLEIGASGEMNLLVSDSRKLLVKLVGTMKGIAWEEQGSEFTKSLSSSFKPLISTVVKANLSNCIKSEKINILEIDENLERLSESIKKKLQSGFEEYGLTIPEFYITTVVLPENDPNFKRIRELYTVSLQKRMVEADTAIKMAMAESAAKITVAERQGILEKEATETEKARKEAERELLRVQAETQAMKMSGFAEAEIMHAKGITQKDILQAEVQKAYAEGIGNMNISSSGGGVASEMIGLGVGLNVANVMSGQMKEMVSGLNPLKEEKTFCPHCQSEISTSSKFCPECGKKIEIIAEDEVICPSCGKKTKKGKFCIECGSPLIMRCSKCGAEMALNAKFCPECGMKRGE